MAAMAMQPEKSSIRVGPFFIDKAGFLRVCEGTRIPILGSSIDVESTPRNTSSFQDGPYDKKVVRISVEFAAGELHRYLNKNNAAAFQSMRFNDKYGCTWVYFQESMRNYGLSGGGDIVQDFATLEAMDRERDTWLAMQGNASEEVAFALEVEKVQREIWDRVSRGEYGQSLGKWGDVSFREACRLEAQDICRIRRGLPGLAVPAKNPIKSAPLLSDEDFAQLLGVSEKRKQDEAEREVKRKAMEEERRRWNEEASRRRLAELERKRKEIEDQIRAAKAVDNPKPEKGPERSIFIED